MSETGYITIHLVNDGWGKPRSGPMEVIVDLDIYTQLVETLRNAPNPLPPPLFGKWNRLRWMDVYNKWWKERQSLLDSMESQ